MNVYAYPSAKTLVVCGDIHGKFDELVYRITAMHGMTDTVVVVAGDCGFGFHRSGYYDQVQSRVLPRLEKAGCWVVFVRGNHDNPAYFDGHEVSHERWCCVSDYSLLAVCGKTVLCVGGAVSVDRSSRQDYRPLSVPAPRPELPSDSPQPQPTASLDRSVLLQPRDYWPSEQSYLDEHALAAIRAEGHAVDTVVSHTSPSCCQDAATPAWLHSLAEADPDLPADLQRDRTTMDALLAALRRDGHPLRHWLYGHFHHSRQAHIDGISYTMLAELEMKEIY